MNKILALIAIVLLWTIPNQTYAQFDIVAKNGVESFSGFDFCPCNIPEDYDRTTRILNALADRERREQLEKIESLIKDEIGKRLRKDFDNFETAAKELFKHNYGRRTAKAALDNLYDEYIENYNNLRERTITLQLEEKILNIRRKELNESSQLGWLKFNENIYLRDLTTNAQIDEQLGNVNEKYNDVAESYKTPRQIITGIQELRSNDKLEDIIADLHFNNYRGQSYVNRVRLMQSYLIDDVCKRNGFDFGCVPFGGFNPPVLNTDGSGEAFREALAAGDGTISDPDLSDQEAIRRFAINSLGKETAAYLSDKQDLKNEVLEYLENKTFARPYLDCTYYLFDTYLGRQEFDADRILYRPDIPFLNNSQNANDTNLALLYRISDYANREGLERFGNVLHEFFKDPNFKPKSYLGNVVADMFAENTIQFPSSITNEQLGQLFNFSRTTNSLDIRIEFQNNVGSILYRNGITINDILNDLANLDLALIMTNLNEEQLNELEANNFSAEAVAEARLKSKFNQLPINGWNSFGIARKYRNRSSLRYTRSYADQFTGETWYQLENGDYVLNSQIDYQLDLKDRNIPSIPVTEDTGTFDYYFSSQIVNDKEVGKWYTFKLPPEDKPLDASLDFLIDGFWTGAKYTARYVIPFEDLIIIIDGKDLDGQEASRLLAGGMLVVGFIPGGKLIKPVQRLTTAIVGDTVLRVITVVGDKVITVTIRKLRKEVLDLFDDAVLEGIVKQIDEAVLKGEFTDEIVEEVAEIVGDIVAAEGKRLNWERVLALFRRGKEFDKLGQQFYDFNEIVLANGKRLDSYIEGLRIISRKATDFNIIKESTFRKYCNELITKYKKGTPLNSKDFPNGGFLKGDYFLEVPISNKNSPNLARFIEIAKEYGITIIFL